MSKIWNKIIDGTSESYSLDKEYSPDWFASVFRHEGKWTFRFGKRIGGESYTTSNKYGTPATAKSQALTHLSQKTSLTGKFRLQ
jgi:hypothetical protein